MSAGTLLDPFTDLKTAFENPYLKDNQTIYLRAGTHYLYEDTTISKSDITIQPYPGEVAVISFKPLANTPNFLDINGNNVRFRNLEITSEPTNREAPTRGNHTGVQLGWIRANGHVASDGLFRNCVLHDLASCAWYGDNGQEGVLYKDCLLYNWGWPVETGEVDGEYLYGQNGSTYPVKSIENSLFGPSFSVGFQIYGESLALDGTSRASNFTFNNCAWFHTYPFISAAGRLNGINFLDSCAWNANMIFGLSNKPESELFMTMTGTWWTSGLAANDDPEFGDFETHTVTGNRFVTLASGRYFYYPFVYGGARVWNSNLYYGLDTTAAFPNGQNFSAWKAASGYDADSTLDTNLPASAWVRIYPCALAPKVAHLVMYNWTSAETLDVDVSSLNLANGNYRLRNAYDPMNDYTDFTYAGGLMTVPFTGRTIATPIAYAEPLVSLDVRFGAFVLETR